MFINGESTRRHVSSVGFFGMEDTTIEPKMSLVENEWQKKRGVVAPEWLDREFIGLGLKDL